MDKIDITTKSKQLSRYNLALHEIIDGEIYEKFAYFEEPYKFNYTVIYKVMTLLDTVSLLMLDLESKRYYFNSIYLLLRTSLSDVVCLYYVFEKFTENGKGKERIQSIMDDHIHSIFHAADTEERRLLIQTFPHCFDSGKLKKTVNKVSVKAMYTQITSPSIKKEVALAMNLYNFFSKLEHNGELSFNIMHKTFTPEGYESSKRKTCDAISTIIRGIHPALLNWIKIDDSRFLNLVSLAKDLIKY